MSIKRYQICEGHAFHILEKSSIMNKLTNNYQIQAQVSIDGQGRNIYNITTYITTPLQQINPTSRGS